MRDLRTAGLCMDAMDVHEWAFANALWWSFVGI